MKTIFSFSKFFLLGCGVFFAQDLFAQWLYGAGGGNNTIYSTPSTRNVGIGTGNVNFSEKLRVQTVDGTFGLTHTSGVITLSTFIGDNTAQIGTRTNHSFRFNTNNIVRMTLSNTGNLGIGTLTPSRLLHLVANNSSSLNSSQLYIQQNGSGDAWMTFRVPDGVSSRYFNMGIDNSDGDKFKIGTSTSVNSGVHTNTFMAIATNGNVGIGVSAPTARLHVDGRITADELELTGGADVAENFDIAASETENEILPGMLVSINPDAPGQLQITDSAYDSKVAGIISGANGVNTGLFMGQKGSAADGKYPVALAGRVYVLADASYGPITPGNLLTSSPTPGYAMKAQDFSKAQGTVVGKAMTKLKEGKGYVLVLVSLQ